MATLIGEDRARRFSMDSRQRSFLVRAASRSEYAEDIVAACGVTFGDFHPRNAGYYAQKPEVSQDPKCWWKFTVTWTYARLSIGEEDPADNPEANPLLVDEVVTVDTEVLMVAAKGEVDASGELIKGITTSAGEAYDPHPEEEREILIIKFERNEGPSFSVDKFLEFQGSVNDAEFDFGDRTIEEGQAKLRIRIGKKERHIAFDGTETEYRRYEYTIVVHPFGHDLKLLDFGTYFKNGSGRIIQFLKDEPNKREMGLLDGSGGKLAEGGSPVFNTWKNNKRADFSELDIPTEP